MKRLAMILVVAVLALSASGVFAISFTDPCEGETESAQGGDQNCPPTCFTCGCCSQAMEPSVVSTFPTEEPVVRSSPRLTLPVASREPRGILHVPRRSA